MEDMWKGNTLVELYPGSQNVLEENNEDAPRSTCKRKCFRTGPVLPLVGLDSRPFLLQNFFVDRLSLKTIDAQNLPWNMVQ